MKRFGLWLSAMSLWLFVVGPAPAAAGDHAALIVAPDLLLLEYGPAVEAALRAEGFAVVSVQRAKKARESSRVYATKEHEAMATRALNALPSGTKIEPLTWKAKAPIVVALGDDLEVRPAPRPVAPEVWNLNLVTVLKLDHLGWTKDGNFAIRTETMGCCGDVLESETDTHVVDPESIGLVTFVNQVRVAGLAEVYAGEAEPDRDAFLSLHRWGEGSTSGRRLHWAHFRKKAGALTSREKRTSAQGRQLKLSASRGSGTWQGDTWVWTPTDGAGDCERGIVVTAEISGAGTTRLPEMETLLCDNQVGEAEPMKARPNWSPDGAHLALTLEGSARPFGFRTHGLVILPARRGSIELLSRDAQSDRADAIARRLGANGFLVARQGTAKTDRKQTVVYARKADRPRARAIAKLLGGTLETLDWKAGADIVVALGSETP